MLSLIEKMRKINPDYNNQWWNYYGIESKASEVNIDSELEKYFENWDSDLGGFGGSVICTLDGVEIDVEGMGNSAGAKNRLLQHLRQNHPNIGNRVEKKLFTDESKAKEDFIDDDDEYDEETGLYKIDDNEEKDEFGNDFVQGFDVESRTKDSVEKLPEDKRKHDSLNFDPSYEAETSDAEYEDWIQDKTDEDTTRDNLEKLQEETVEESFGDCGCKMTNKAKETWERLTDSDKQLELRNMEVDEGYAYYPFEHLPKKIGEAFVDKFNMELNGDSLGWNKIPALERAQTLRKIGFTPRDSELVANLEYQQLSESLKKDVNEALNYKVKTQESQVPKENALEKFEDGLYSNMYDGYLERRGARVDSKKKEQILENNDYGLDISKVKGVESKENENTDFNNQQVIDFTTINEDEIATCDLCGKTWDMNDGSDIYDIFLHLSIVHDKAFESKATEKKVWKYCNRCGYETEREEGESCPYHQSVLEDGTFLWDEFNQDGESKANEVSIDDFKRIVDRHQNETLQFDDGKVIVDAFTANAVVQVYNALSEERKQKFNDVVKTSGGVSKLVDLAFKYGESKANEKIPLSTKGLKLPRQMDFKTGGYAGMNDWGGEATLCEICGANFNTYPEFLDHYQEHDEAQGVDFYTESKANEFTMRDFEQNEDINAHTDNALQLAKLYGTQDEINDMERIKEEYEHTGFNRGQPQDNADYNRRYEIQSKYWSMFLRSEGEQGRVYGESKATERDFYRSNKEISDQGDDIQAEAEFGKKYSELSDSEKGYIEYIKNEFGDVKSYDEWVTSGTESKANEGLRDLCENCKEANAKGIPHESPYNCLFDPEGSGNMCGCSVCGNDSYEPNEYQIMQRQFGSDGGSEISDLQYESKSTESDEEENYDQRDESELEGGSYDDGASSTPDNWYRTEDGQWKVVGDEPYEGESKTSEEVESKEELEQRISELQNYLEHAVTQEIPVMPKMRKMLSLIEKMRKINPDYNNQWWNYYGIESKASEVNIDSELEKYFENWDSDLGGFGGSVICTLDGVEIDVEGMGNSAGAKNRLLQHLRQNHPNIGNRVEKKLFTDESKAKEDFIDDDDEYDEETGLYKIDDNEEKDEFGNDFVQGFDVESRTKDSVEKLPEDKRKHDSLNFDPSYEAETSDAEYEDWIQDKTDEDTTRDNLEKLQEETVEESFGDCGCKMTNKAKETWERLTDSDKQLELRNMEVDEGYAYYPFEHLPKKIGEAFVDKFNMELNGDSLGWNKIPALERAQTLRKIGFTPRDSELVANLEYQQLSESLKKDVNEALNYKVKTQESQVPKENALEKFEDGLYSNMYDGYLERRGARVDSKKKEQILENNNYGLDISKVKGVESKATEVSRYSIYKYLEWKEHVIDELDRTSWNNFAKDEGFAQEEANRVWYFVLEQNRQLVDWDGFFEYGESKANEFNYDVLIKGKPSKEKLRDEFAPYIYFEDDGENTRVIFDGLVDGGKQELENLGYNIIGESKASEKMWECYNCDGTGKDWMGY